MRVLTIDDDQRTAIKHLVNFARQPDAWYKPGRSRWIPGDNPQYVLHVDSYRCVFTYTLMLEGTVYRHLSLSVPGKAYPHPLATKIIADMFGFTGSREAAPDDPGFGPDWLLDMHEDENCIVVAQVVMEPGKAEA